MIIAKGQDLIEVKPEIIVGGIYDVDLPRDTGTHILERRRPCLILCRHETSPIYGAIPLTSEKEGKDYCTNKNTKYVQLNVDRTVVSYACINQFRPVDERMIDVTKLSGKLHPNKVKSIIHELMEYIDQDNICTGEVAQMKEALSKASDEVTKLRLENQSLRKEVATLRLELDSAINKSKGLEIEGSTSRCVISSRNVIVPSPAPKETSNLNTNSIITLDKKFDIPWTQKSISSLPEDDIIELFTIINRVGFRPMAKARGVNQTTLSSIKQGLARRNQKIKDAISMSKGQRGLMATEEVEIRFVDNTASKEESSESITIPAELPNYRHMGLTMYKALNLSLEQMKEFVEYSKAFDISKMAEAYGISNTVTASKIRARLVSKVQESKRCVPVVNS